MANSTRGSLSRASSPQPDESAKTASPPLRRMRLPRRRSAAAVMRTEVEGGSPRSATLGNVSGRARRRRVRRAASAAALSPENKAHELSTAARASPSNRGTMTTAEAFPNSTPVHSDRVKRLARGGVASSLPALPALPIPAPSAHRSVLDELLPAASRSTMGSSRNSFANSLNSARSIGSATSASTAVSGDSARTYNSARSVGGSTPRATSSVHGHPNTPARSFLLARDRFVTPAVMPPTLRPLPHSEAARKAAGEVMSGVALHASPRADAHLTPRAVGSGSAASSRESDNDKIRAGASATPSSSSQVNGAPARAAAPPSTALPPLPRQVRRLRAELASESLLAYQFELHPSQMPFLPTKACSRDSREWHDLGVLAL